MALHIPIYIIIIAIGLIFGVFPFLGRLIYIIKHKVGRLLSVYFLCVAALFALGMILSDSINLNYTVEIFKQLNGFKFVYIASLFLYFFAGFGFFGSLAEKSVEILEEIDLLSTLEKRKSLLKQYLMYVIFGYVFVFCAYALSKLLLLLLGVVTSKYIWETQLFTALGFESVVLVSIGVFLFLLKSFNYGVFSRENWKSLSAEESEDTTWRISRKLIIIFIFIWAIYTLVIVFFVQYFSLGTSLFTNDVLTYETTIPIFHSLQIAFYLTTTIQTLYFLTHIYKLVSALKSVDPNFKKKVDNSIKINEDDDIKF